MNKKFEISLRSIIVSIYDIRYRTLYSGGII